MSRYYILLFVMTFAATAYGQSSLSFQPHLGPLGHSLTGTSATTVTPSNEWDALNTTSTLDSFFTAILSTYHVPGLAACIVKKDSILWQGYYGYADLPKNKPITDSTIFMACSISKTIIVTALMQLYERGKFKLDDSVNAYLPFQVRNPRYPGTPITFRMLLTHTSSIRDNWNVMPWQPGDYPIPLATYCQEYFTPGGQYYNASLNFSRSVPGTTYQYSNIGGTLAGYLVEVMSGVPFDNYCRDSVFVPLQMSKASWFLRDLDTNLVARPYTYSSGMYVDNGLLGFPFYPCGQLRMTAASLARFLMANINGGELRGTQILDTATVRMIRTVYVPTIVSPFQYQGGLIWWKEQYTRHKLWGHDGSFLGAATAMYLSEVDSTGVIFLANTDWSFPLESTIVNRLIDEAHTITGGVHNTIADVPELFQLFQNYPNPFNPSTTIKFELSKSLQVRLSVYDMLGREVAVLVNKREDAGVHQTKFDASNLASGVYLYRLQAGELLQSRKLIILR
jgi:CubicO group peptidase (beta-lactamase class C family)